MVEHLVPDTVPEILEASYIFLLMKKEYRISRNIRAQWYLSHLNKCVRTGCKKTLEEYTEEISVISAVPKTRPASWSIETSDDFQYLVSPDTKVIFLSRGYRLVFCLDLSPSTAAVDIQNGNILFDEVFTALRKSLTKISQPFYVPSSHFVFQPKIYITVMAHMPFYAQGGEQVLVQGWCLKSDNVDELLKHACNQYQVGKKIVEATAYLNEERAKLKAQPDILTGGLFDEFKETQPHSHTQQITITTPDINTVNMLRYGILALQLLPENTSAGIIIVTDGMLTLPNTVMLESLLTQLRNNTIACSFIHLGSTYHPFCSLGYVPYTDLMRFISVATLGAYLPFLPEQNYVRDFTLPYQHHRKAGDQQNGKDVSNEVVEMNVYHKAFLTWNFQGGIVDRDDVPPSKKWVVSNQYFGTKFDQLMVRKRQKEGNLQVSLSSVLSCRLREGYTVKKVRLKGDHVEITLTLPWKFNASIDYTLSALTPNGDRKDKTKQKHPSCHYEISIEGTYDFLHDVTCSMKKKIDSPYRAAVVKQFWSTMKNLTDTDQLLVHLQSFGHNSVYYLMPESVKNRLPLFYLTPNATSPSLSSKTLAHHQFASFWRPICMLDINIWQKWMHTHRIGIILEHDMPLSKNIHIPNSSGRYHMIQCRQALTSLNALLRDFSSFVLIENHSYIKFLTSEPDKPPYSFYIIRVSSKAPCMVIRLAFLGGMSGKIRNEIVNELRTQIVNLKFPRRGIAKEVRVISESHSGNHRVLPPGHSKSPLQRDWMDVNCCVILKKPVEKILIKYCRVPNDFHSPISSQVATGSDPLATNMLTTLSSYLHNQRWIWNMQAAPNSPLPMIAVAGILNSIIKLRLQEGFHVAHSHSGIINLVLEINMEHQVESEELKVHPCVVQYIIFPPFSSLLLRDSVSDDDDGDFESAEADGEPQIITECWIEPQDGKMSGGLPRCDFMRGLTFQQVAKSFLNTDITCVSSLVTFHHLALMCTNEKVQSPYVPCGIPPVTPVTTPVISDLHSFHMSAARSTPDFNLSQASLQSHHTVEEKTSNLSFPFDLMALLPFCQQAELIFSTYIQDLIPMGYDIDGRDNQDVPNTVLYSHLIEMLKQAHHREVHLSDHDNASFPHHVLERDRPSKVYRVPFPASDISRDAFRDFASEYQGSSDASKLKSSPGKSQDHLHSPDIKKGNSLKIEVKDVFFDPLPKWKCYVKALTENHLLVTLLPASYQDLRLLILGSAASSDMPNYLGTLPYKAVRVVKRENDAENAHLADESHQTSGGEGRGEFSGSFFGGTDSVDGLAQSSKVKIEPSLYSEVVASSPQPREAVKLLGSPTKTPASFESSFKISEPSINVDDVNIERPPPELYPPRNANQIYGSLTLPIYCYHCSLNNINTQIIFKEDAKRLKDLYHDFSYKMDEVNYLGEDTVTRKSSSVSHEGSKQATPEPNSKSESDWDGNTTHQQLKEVSKVIENIYSKSFVQGVFKCLQQGYRVDSQDIEAAVDSICVESILEIDISPFLQVICGHVRDFHLRTTFEQQHPSQDKADDAKKIQKYFPLEVLQRFLPCEQLKQLHNSIKEQFSESIQQYFKPISTHPDYAFFCPPEDFDENDEGDDKFAMEEKEVNEEENNQLLDDIEFTSEADTKESENDVNSPPNDSQHQFNSDHEEDNESVIENERPIAPLFVHLTCTLKYKNNVGSCSLMSLPTCLSEVISCLEGEQREVDLTNLQITLDFICLTLDSENERSINFAESSLRTLSYCSSASPILEAETSNYTEHSSDYLKDLPSRQYDSVQTCVKKVKWLLQDEIAAAALQNYPLKESTIEMVVEHVTQSIGIECCCLEEVPLKFVFGVDKSLEKFKEAFDKCWTSLPGYHLEKENEYHYLVRNEDVELQPVTQQQQNKAENEYNSLDTRKTPVDQRRSPYVAGDDPELVEINKRSLSMIPSVFDSNILTGPTATSQYSELRASSSSFFSERKSFSKELSKIPECLTTNDEEEDDESNRKRGRSKPTRKTSARSSRERSLPSNETSTFVDKPASFTDSNLKDDVILVKPLATKGRLSITPESPSTIKRMEIPVDNSNFVKVKKNELTESSEATDSRDFVSSQTVSECSSTTMMARTPDPQVESSVEDTQNSTEMTTTSDEKQSEGSTVATNSSKGDSTVASTSSRPVSKTSTPGLEYVILSEPREGAESLEVAKIQEQAQELGKEVSSPSRKMILGRTDSCSSTPFMYSDAGRVSNTEDGYEGDSSDSGSELGWLNVRRSLLPKFWLIMKIHQDKVSVYFHIRHRKNPDEELRNAKELFQKAIKTIKNLLKVINQTMLLQDLHQSFKCHQLLVPEASEDIWKSDDGGRGVASSRLHSIDIDPEDMYNNHNSDENYLEAEMKFKPGAFDCPIVWTTHFHFHPRLSSGPGRTMSRGVQALRSALNTLSVTNRKNMFAYKQPNGSVFYLRLHETTCNGHRTSKNEEDFTLGGGSRSSSVHSLQQKKTVLDAEEEFALTEFRPRVNSALSDKDQNASHDSVSISSRVSSNRKSNQQCIALNFHGIVEVDGKIKEELVKMLQNGLDEAVLESITVMMARNAKSKLTPEDVQFIQKPGKEPTFVLHFTINSNTLKLLGPLVYYLRQNLLSFLHNPNYTDSKMENHFQPYNGESSMDLDGALNFSDEDVFLYSIQQQFGMSGNKGIACIILSLVDGQGRPVKHISSPIPMPNAYTDTLLSHDYEELTGTSLFQLNPSKKSPGPIALIRFQIWCVGKIQQESLTGKLGAAMRHALWDLLMEYRLLTSPLAEPIEGDNCGSVSEPSTPIKRRRRSGRVLTEQVKEYSPTLSPTDSLYFFKQYAGTMNVDTPSSITGSLSSNKIGALSSMLQPEPRNVVYDAGEKGRLTEVFSTTMRDFLEFGKTIGVPTVVSSSYNLKSHHQIPILLHQFQLQLQELSNDVVSKVFLKHGMDYLPYNAQLSALTTGVRPEKLPGKSRDFIVVGRNLNLWRAFMGNPEHTSYLGTPLLKQQKHYQKYQPYIPGTETSGGMTTSLSRTANATPTSCLGSPTSVPVSTPISIGPFASSFNPYQLNSATNSTESLGYSYAPFIPRQRLLLIILEGNTISLYLYNWLTEVSNAISKLLTKLVEWINQRSLAVTSVVCQKLGIFHNQPLFRKMNKVTKEKNVSYAGVAPPNHIMAKHLEVLLANPSPPNQNPSGDQQQVAPVRKSNTFSAGVILEPTIRDRKPHLPVQCSEYRNVEDLALRFHLQIKDIQNTFDRRVMEDLHRVWKSRDPHVNIPYLDKVMHSVKSLARLSHFCLTPILFSPNWRWKVAPVRDHTLEPVQNKMEPRESNPFPTSTQRSRHSSGSSVKSSVDTSSSNNSLASSFSSFGRMRKISGNVNPLLASVMQKPRKSQTDEKCHFEICKTYINEYIEFLQTLGFVAIQTGAQSHRKTGQGRDLSDVRKASHDFGKRFRSSNIKDLVLPVFLIKNLLGGLLIFELGFCDPYAYAHLYSLESKRLLSNASPTQRSQFTTVFLDQLDKIKITMHLHSFTYNFHLRTIFAYISGQQLLFRQGYHISSFLNDFIKYYQKSPNFARNFIASGTLVIDNTRVEGSQLYNYIISHNEHYGMTVVRMEPIFKGSDMDTDFALVELSSYKCSYKDANDINNVGNFDVGLLVTYDKEANTQQSRNNHVLVLKFYILLTSQRDLYPKLVLGSTLGTFQPVRFGSRNSRSRKNSSNVAPNQNELTSSTERDNKDSVTVNADDVSRKMAVPLTMCDEEVEYLGYFSTDETLMLNILKDRMKTTRKHLEAIVGRAGVHCCRDSLWSSLFPRLSESKDLIVTPMTYAQFKELLSLATSVPINEVDQNLTPFLNMHYHWYQNLSKLVLNKYSNTSRIFSSPDGNTQHLVLTDIKCPDAFIKLTMDQQSNHAEISLVFREPLFNQDHSPEKPNLRILALQSLVEDFVNHCCFHLWSGLLG